MRNRRTEIQRMITFLQGESLEAGLAALTMEEENRHQQLLVALNDLRLPIDRIERRLQVQRDKNNAFNPTEILNWLSTIPYQEHHRETGYGVLRGTGDWFLADSRLREWQRLTSPSFLWLHGMLGCGKSKLT